MKCNICENKHEGQTHFSRFSTSLTVCTPCSLSEAFVRVNSPCVTHEGKSPEVCGIGWESWVEAVLSTRRETTDAYLLL